MFYKKLLILLYNQSAAVTNIHASPPLQNYRTHHTSTKDARKLPKALSDTDFTFPHE
jgi:hypothetical protein